VKQLTLYFSRDLEDSVVAALDLPGIDGFVRLGDATGSRFAPAGELPRTVGWNAAVILVPAAPDDAVETVLGRLRPLGEPCEAEACLRVTVSTVERLL
jgi:hypothetical protein